MTVQVLPDVAALARAAADLIVARIQAAPSLSVLVATGQTPMGTYAELARRVEAGQLDTSRVTALQLDEYAGLTDEDPRSLWRWMERAFVKPLGVQRVVRLAGDDPDPQAACARYTRALGPLGPVGLAVLGLGPNGHLGFNEPPSPPDAPTRLVTLTPESRASNARYWPGLGVPERALTAGMDVILGAREVLLLVSGAHKRAVLQSTLHGPRTPELPASLLDPARLTVLADEAALPPGRA